MSRCLTIFHREHTSFYLAEALLHKTEKRHTLSQQS